MNRTLTGVRVAGNDGLNGRRFHFSLNKADIFVGPNASGKSTCLLAIHAGLRGISDAPLDLKKGSDPRAFIGMRPDAEITLTWNDATLSRNLSASKGRMVDGPNLEADRIVGPHLVRVDLQDFAMASDTVRAKLLEQACAAGAGGASAASLVPDLCASLGIKVPEPVKADGPGLFGGAVLNTAVHPFYDLLLAKPVDGATPSPWLEGALAWTGEAFAKANADVRTATAAVTEYEVAERTLAPLPGTLGRAESRLAELREDLARIDSAVLLRKARKEALASRAGEGERLVEAVGHAAMLLAEEEEALAAARAVPPVDVPAAQTASDKAVEARDACRAAGVGARIASMAAEADRVEAGRRRDAAQTEIHTLQALAGDVGGVSLACQHCSGADPLNLAGRIGLAEQAFVALLEALDDAEADATIATAAVNTRIAAFRTAEAAEATTRLALESARMRETGRLAGVKFSTDAIVIHKAAKEVAEDAFAAWQAREEEATAGTQGEHGDEADVAERHASLTAEIADADAEVKEHVRQAERTRGQQAAIVRRETATARIEQVKAVKAALLALQAKFAQGAYAPLESAANELLERACVKERVVIKSESEFGAMVMNAQGTERIFVNFWSLCGSERVLVGVSMAYAFAVLSRSPWPVVMLDALEVVDRVRLPTVVQALTQLAHEGKIANVILAMHEVDYDKVIRIDGLTEHWLGRKPAAS